MGKPFKVNDSTLLISTEAPGGLYNSEQLKAIAEVSGEGVAIVKVTEDQRLAVFVNEAQLEEVQEKLGSNGLSWRHYQSGLHQPTACLGAHCPMHVQDALQGSIDIASELVDIGGSKPLRMGINGCARSCVPTHTLDVSIIGDSNGYRISLGGKNSQIPEMGTFVAEGVPAEKLAGLVGKVARVFHAHANDDECLHDVIDRVGISPFVEALAPYSQDAASQDEDPFAALDDNDDEALKLIEMNDHSEAGSQTAGDFDMEDLPSADDFAEPSADVVAESAEGLDIDPSSFDDGTIDSDVPIGDVDIGDDLLTEDVELAQDLSASLEDGDEELDLYETSMQETEMTKIDDDLLLEPELLDDNTELELLEDSTGSVGQDDTDEMLEEELEDELTRSIAEEERLGEDDDDQAHERFKAVSMVEHSARHSNKEAASVGLRSVSWKSPEKVEVVLANGVSFQFDGQATLENDARFVVELGGINIQVSAFEGELSIAVGNIEVILPSQNDFASNGIAS